MPQGARAARITAALSAGCLVATLVGVVVASRPSHATGSDPADAAVAAVRPAPVTVQPAGPTQSDGDQATLAAENPAAAVAPAARTASAPAPAAYHPVVITEQGVRYVNSCDQDVPAGHVSCYAERRVDAAAEVRPTTDGVTPMISSPPGLHPSDLADAYGLSPATGGVGQTVYVIDAFDDPSAESDLAMYRSTFGLPDCTTANGCFRKLNANGLTGPLPAADTQWAGEISLDLDMVSAVCPNCDITLIEAGDTGTGMFTAVNRANLLGAGFVSMSWGGHETSASTMAAMDQAYFAQTGVVYAAASGDDGYAKGVIYPATSNRVVAVGGTRLVANASNARGWTETAWSLAGSGCSAVEPAADWQVGATPCPKRGTTDVSAVADPATGVSVYQTYGADGWTIYGGTSASTPIITSVFALAGAPNPTINPAALLYRHPSGLYDITSGSNGSCTPAALCTATAGWDGPTGLGAPHGLTAFQIGRSSHTTSPGHTLSPGWPRGSDPTTITNTAVPAAG